MTDWLMVIITAVYVIATIVICIYNIKMVKAAQEQTETAKQQITEMIRQYDESHRPIVVISYVTIRTCLHCFKIENIGPVAATNIKIRINDEFLDNLEKNSELHFLRGITETTPMLSSQQKLYIALCGPLVFKDVASVPAIFDISYNGKYEEHTEIDLSQYKGILLYNSELGDIAEDIKGIRNESKNDRHTLIETISKINPVSFLVNTGYERRKFDTYKAVCLNPCSTTERIAEIVEISKEEALDILMELKSVDRLVHAFPCDDDAFHTQWIKR